MTSSAFSSNSKLATPFTTPRDEQRAQQLKEWKFDCAIARSEGKEPPPRPRSALVRPSISSAISNKHVKRQRVPMGMTQHKASVTKRTELQVQELIAGLKCRTPESAALEMSRDAYMEQVARATAALEPSPSVRLTLNSRSNSRKSNVGQGSGDAGRTATAFMPRARQVTDLAQALKNAKRSREAPPLYQSPTFNFDKLRAELDAKDEEAEQLLEGKAQRKRLFPKKLDPQRQRIVDNVFANSSFSSAITNASVQLKDIKRLRGQTWLNDEIITFYSQLLNLRAAEAEKARDAGGNDVMSLEEAQQYKKIHAFNSFFWKNISEKGHSSVKRWTRKIDLFAKDIVIIPINQDNIHWVCGAINIKEKRFEYYNSLGAPLNFVYKTLRDYLSAEYAAKNPGKTLDLTDWENYWDEDVPQQANASDCGVFTCQFMECLSRNVDGFDFDQKQMPYFRNKMVLELAEKRLIPEEWGPA